MARAAAPVQRLIARAVAALRGPTAQTGSVVHLALSGGVDSSVSAFLLRERGWDVRPVILRCWAGADDGSDASCFEREVRASEAAVRALALTRRLSVFDFVSDYWNEVFDGVLLSGLAAGVTPNQDLACNRAIKFGAFPRRLAAEAGTSDPPPFATGHYARLADAGDGPIRLLRAADDVKDQTYFLASVPGDSFRGAMFPIGGLVKPDVRRIAAHAGLPAAADRSSRGICFVGKRRMGEFTARYLDVSARAEPAAGGRLTPAPSFILDARRIAPLPRPAHCYTLGQRARVGGSPERLYVTGREGADVIVKASPPMTRRVVCGTPHWIGGTIPAGLRSTFGRRLLYKGNSTTSVAECRATLLGDGRLEVTFDVPRAAIAPGQAVVLYAGEEVLGSGLVQACAEDAAGGSRAG
jgi:tRNA (5-methylaminomethyl-2-thiouridylate)-methyltransferase